MTNSDPPSPTDDAFCLGCGYALRRLESSRCPECGRAFDPADPRSMSTGRPLRRWQRWLLRPMGWPMIVLALLGTAGFIYLGGWPRLSPEPWSVLREEFRWPAQSLRPFTAPDIIFYVTVSLWAGFLVLFTPRQLARLLVPRAARRSNVMARSLRRRNRVVAVATVLSASWLAFGWQHRIGRRWVVRIVKTAPTTPSPVFLPYYPWPDPPVRLTPEQASLVLGDAIVHLPDAHQRMVVLKLLVETRGKAAVKGLLRVADRDDDPALLAWDLRLIGLCRDPGTESLLTARLQDRRAEVRAAAADAIGILRHPSYSVGLPDGGYMAEPMALASTPPIGVGGVVSAAPEKYFSLSGYAEHDLIDDPSVAIDPAVRPILQRMMVDGETPQEREAAARALVDWPPDRFSLRVAEWGVWINNDGNMALAKSLLDEIPPFVHRTGNPVSSFANYFLYPMNVNKPIVHVTSSVTMAADVEVHIRAGRPWFGYPMPDDFGIGNEDGSPGVGAVGVFFPSSAPSTPNDFTNPAIDVLPDCREGYPWLVPHHRFYSSGGTHFGNPAVIYNLGLRWQSVIVCPERAAWMAPAAIPSEPRFRWWARLREVPSSWVASRGEAERFLYYDGPTHLAVPVAVTLEQPGNRLRFKAIPEGATGGQREEDPKHPFQPLSATPPKNVPPREGLCIEVHSGVVRGQRMTVDENMPVGLNLPLHGDAVVQELRRMLTAYGLTGPEAEGLIAAWTPQFFQTEGRRFLLRMSAADYDWQCPMQVRPKPTEVVRLGLVLTEFDAKPDTRPAAGEAPRVK